MLASSFTTRKMWLFCPAMVLGSCVLSGYLVFKWHLLPRRCLSGCLIPDVTDGLHHFCFLYKVILDGEECGGGAIKVSNGVK